MSGAPEGAEDFEVDSVFVAGEIGVAEMVCHASVVVYMLFDVSLASARDGVRQVAQKFRAAGRTAGNTLYDFRALFLPVDERRKFGQIFFIRPGALQR